MLYRVISSVRTRLASGSGVAEEGGGVGEDAGAVFDDEARQRGGRGDHGAAAEVDDEPLAHDRHALDADRDEAAGRSSPTTVWPEISAMPRPAITACLIVSLVPISMVRTACPRRCGRGTGVIRMRVPEPVLAQRNVSSRERRGLDPRRRGERMVGGDDDDVRVGAERLGLDRRLARRTAHDREVEPPLGQRRDGLPAVADLELDFDVSASRAGGRPGRGAKYLAVLTTPSTTRRLEPRRAARDAAASRQSIAVCTARAGSSGAPRPRASAAAAVAVAEQEPEPRWS